MEDLLLLIFLLLDFAGGLHLEEDEEYNEKVEKYDKLGGEFRIASSSS